MQLRSEAGMARSSEARRTSWLRYDAKRRRTDDRRLKERARGRTRKLPKSGVCEECGAIADTVWHHDDYRYPDDAEELCHKCHRARHPRRMPSGVIR